MDVEGELSQTEGWRREGQRACPVVVRILSRIEDT